MNFEVFYLVMKHCVECLILLLEEKKKILEGEIKDAKLSSFSSDFQMHSLNILNFLCIFFEKLDSGTFTDVTGTNKTYINI